MLRGVTLALASLVVGCSASTYVASAAPALDPGWRYVVGQRAGRPTAWICPEEPGRGECREIEVLEEER